VSRMGDIGQIARKMVTEMIRQKEPKISDEELQVLLDHWLPGTRAREEGQETARGLPQALPPDLLISRVSQFVGASTGSLPPKERGELPSDWREQYWESFPHAIRDLVNAHLDGRLGEVEFWQRILAAAGL
jgi:hypothetical protein